MFGVLASIPLWNIVLDNWPVYSIVVTGRSMQPTIQPDEHWCCWVTQKIGRGDVVLLYSPTGDRNKLFVKRVIAVEGDLLVKDREPSHVSGLNEVVAIPRGHVWVEGDNGACSSDSNAFGPVPHSLILGRFVLRTSPRPWKLLPDALHMPSHRVVAGYLPPSHVNPWRVRDQARPPREHFSSEFISRLQLRN